MNKRIALFAVGLASAGVLAYGLLINATAQSAPITDQQIERIKGSCLSAKNTLNQLHSSDALLRVNGGQVYESIASKLMKQFNGRVSYNNFDSTDFTVTTGIYERTLDEFRLKYKAYEEQLSKALEIDCSKQPVAFYDAVALSREKRAEVHAEVVKLHTSIDDYQTVFDQFSKQYQTTEKEKE
ncbi:MAG TPA: hypothetical protein VFS65_01360 [Candidatus Saccharimonadales bacterium]|nr:hypothetical protein [Candidatus Saccharimonadales bacterium]